MEAQAFIVSSRNHPGRFQCTRCNCLTLQHRPEVCSKCDLTRVVTVEQYAKEHKVSRSTAFRRLTVLVQEGKAMCRPGYVEHAPSNFSDVRKPPPGRINYYRLKGPAA